MATARNAAREYLRVSADKSGRERSPEEQHDDHVRAAGPRKWTLGEAYRDVGSASRHARKRRVGFDQLVADLAEGRFGADVLMMWESSRGSRKVSEWVRLIELCEEQSVQIYVTSDGKLYDPADARDRRSLLEDSVDAEYESAKVSKRTRRAAAANAVAGKPHGAVPYGYRRRRDPETGRVIAQEIEPAEAAVIRELFDRLNKGHSLRGIATDFTARGIVNRAGKPFTAQDLRSRALRRSYVGERVHDPDRTGNGTKLSATAEIAPATWPAIVSRSLFLAVQRRLTAEDRVTTRPGRGVHLLSMIGRCDVCAGPLSARVRRDSGPERREYVCHAKTCVRVLYDELNDLAEGVILAYLARPDNVARLTANSGDDEMTEAARADVLAIRAELDDLAAQVGSGSLSATLAARAEPAIVARLKAAEKREAELTRPSVLNGIITPGKDVRRRWRAAPMSARREVARLLLSPAVIGELRVTRVERGGYNVRVPVEERVTWRQS